MKIIKEGDQSKSWKNIIFKCENCGCEFQMDESDKPIIRISHDHLICEIIIQCPNCNNFVSQVLKKEQDGVKKRKWWSL